MTFISKVNYGQDHSLLASFCFFSIKSSLFGESPTRNFSDQPILAHVKILDASANSVFLYSTGHAPSIVLKIASMP